MTIIANGYHHITRTGGASLVRMLYANVVKPWRVIDVDATKLDLSVIDVKDSECILFHSHNAFGVHKLVDWKVSYFTIIREPVEHVISEFYWKHGLDLSLIEDAQIIRRLEQFVDSFDNLNHQSYELATFAQNRRTPRAHMVPENLIGSGQDYLQQALQNIDTMFEFVGKTNRPSETYAYIKQAFNFDIATDRSDGFRNRSMASTQRGSAIRAMIPLSVIETIKRKTTVDRLLYERADNRLPDVGERMPAQPVSTSDNTYAATVGKTWLSSMEALLGLGARVETIEMSEGHPLEWRLDLYLPVQFVGTCNLNVCLALSGSILYGQGIKVDLAVKIGSAEDLHLLVDETTVIKRSRIMSGEEVVAGRLPIKMVGRVVIDEPWRGYSVANPLPHFLQSIELNTLPLYRLGTDMLFGKGSQGEAAVVAGFMKNHSPDFTWSSETEGAIAFQLDEDSRFELEDIQQNPDAICGVLELDLAPMFVSKKVLGQTIHLSVNKQKEITLPVYGERRRSIGLFIGLENYMPGDPLTIAFRFPQACSLAEIIGHHDETNRLSVMIFKLRILPIISNRAVLDRAASLES